MSHPTLTRRMARWFADRTLVPVARRSGSVKQLLRYVTQQVPGVAPTHLEEVYGHMRACFIRNGEGTKYEPSLRREIVERFEAIDANVKIASSPTDGLFLAEAVLSVDAEGDIVECGCFNGGSTAKLSIVTRAVGRRLVVFDSFEGLPAADEYNRNDLHVRMPAAWFHAWSAGDWSGAQEVVAGNVARYGEIDVCRFVKGWFKDTLLPANLPERISVAFTDVDLPSSARECLEAIWPRLAERGVFFSHDVGFVKVLYELTSDRLWRDVFHEPVPVVYGAGYGLGDTSRMLGFMIKGGNVPPEYVKRISIDK